MLIYIIFKVKIVDRYLNAMVFGQVNFLEAHGVWNNQNVQKKLNNIQSKWLVMKKLVY